MHAGAFTVDSRTLRHVFYRVEARRGYEAVSDLWSPGYFRAELAPGAEVTLVASTESWDTIGALSVRHAQAAERERRHRLLAGRATRGAQGGHRRRAGPGRRSVHHHAGRPGARRRALPRGRRRGAHGHRRIPLVHRLGPRHDDQPRGAGPGHRALCRGRLHPPHVRLPRARRPHSQHVSRRRGRGALPHRGRHAVVLPRHRPLRDADRRPRDPALAPAPAE